MSQPLTRGLLPRARGRGAWEGWCLFAAMSVAVATTSVHGADPKVDPDVTLHDIVSGRARIVDLSYPLNANANYWPGENYHPFRLETIATLEEHGVLSKAVSFPEHIGTHLDAPNHFEPNQPSVAEIPEQDLFAPGIVIDVRMQAEVNADYALSFDDVRAWEEQHGRIPDGAVVLLNTGWSRFWTIPERYQGRDTLGALHFPSYSGEAAQFLIEERDAKGLGIDTLSIDRGISKTFEVHHIVNRAGRYGIENVTRLDDLPPRGFYLVVAPIKVEAGTGGPTRLFAILPETP